MKENVQSRLKKLGIRPTQTLGQNFLRKETIAEKIVDAAEIYSKDTVLEIGPGLGILTDKIVEKASNTILVEKDDSLVGYLEGKYGDKDEDIEIINDDVLELDLPDFDKVISNLPFSISSPVTFKLLKNDFEWGVCTYQKQFAERMVAEAGEEEYSRLSVMVSTLARVESLFRIPRNEFYPPPKVDAAVVRIIPSRPDFPLKYDDAFSKVVKALFNYRRKKIKNALSTALDKEIKKVPYKDKRVGNLPPDKINELVNYLVEKDMIDDLEGSSEE